eukprot:CAMPEP_0185580014 /NCGR_PEP_ID=MMETSP0434-20130131/15552_1 /TAXON_ID=626734 ORGANISM="Favella taraikaensis, Strain Fe Narragansett Bay" /NCGR_SAMPLE_ID=MMETSP0434 /ASSEMBLY_ACC=CAM_ASM_000379 /LENGTH=397 /DNA_ID=CAMNT_0028198159 /DNA_START=217 /DNA_END=1407 /DNA_ORIENTATION=-
MNVRLSLGLNVGEGDWVLVEVLNHGLELVELCAVILTLSENNDANVGALGAAKCARATLNLLLCQLSEIGNLGLLWRRVGVVAHELSKLVDVHLAFVLLKAEVLGVCQGNNCGESSNAELFDKGLFGLLDLAEVEPLKVLLGESLIDSGGGLLFREEDDLVLGGSVTLNEGVKVLRGDHVHEALHFLRSSIHDVVRAHLAIVFVAIVREVLREDQDLGHLVDAELLAELLLLEAVDGADFDDAVEALANRDVLLLEFFALLQLRVEEVDDPDFLSAVELEHLAQIKLDDIRVLEQVGDRLLSLLLLVEVLVTTATLLEVEVTTATTAATATAEEVSEDVIKVHILEVLMAATSTATLLLVLAHAFFTSLVINAALIGIAERLVGVGNLLELLLGRVW